MTFTPSTDAEKEQIVSGLVAYNFKEAPAAQSPHFQDLSRTARVERGRLAGGVIACMYGWRCVHVDTLWVAEGARGAGLGGRLLSEVEAEARRRGAALIHLDTFDFQARAFYEKRGYRVFGTLEDCPEGHCRYYLQKRLDR